MKIQKILIFAVWQLKQRNLAQVMEYMQYNITTLFLDGVTYLHAVKETSHWRPAEL